MATYPCGRPCIYEYKGLLSELHLVRLCRTKPVAPVFPSVDLVGAATRRKTLRLCGGQPFFPHCELSDNTPLHRWRFELTRQHTASTYQAL
jgi:hypothetical protein